MRQIESLSEIAQSYDAVVLDQWGVLHDGTRPYGGAVAALEALAASGIPLAVLSNSGKRAAPNLARIVAMGFRAELFAQVMTSGEALWQDIARGAVAARKLLPIERASGDAKIWAEGLDLELTDNIARADAVLLMGLADNGNEGGQEVMAKARGAGLPVLCTNPDRASPRAGGQIVISPGALAHDYAEAGGEVVFYGKPYVPIFRALEAQLGTAKLLMVGDSPEHDIAGGAAAGWDTVFVRGGLHAAEFASDDVAGTVARLSEAAGAPLPDYTIAEL